MFSPLRSGHACATFVQKRRFISRDFFGDGAAQRGDFHEGLNFAGVFKLPIVFILENNGFAEMTPLAKHFAGSDFACRAQGYGFPGKRVDGNDVLEVYEAVQDAVARARSGDGPTLLECVTYRLRGHSESHPPTELRAMAEIEAWRAKDPIPRLRTQLLQHGVLSDDLVQTIDAEVKAVIDDAVEWAENSPPPAPDELYRHVYALESPEVVVGRRP